MNYTQSQLLSDLEGVRAGFGNRISPIPLGEENLPVWKQVHGVRVVEVTTPHQECGETDGLYTCQSGTVLGVRTADCVPILLATRESPRAVAALHAGWRGTAQGIVKSFFETIPDELKDREWIASLGPSIQACCFEVGEEVIQEFEPVCQKLGIDRDQWLKEGQKIDLHAINEKWLSSHGVKTLEKISHCTRCSENPAYFSYRRDRDQGRQISQITMY